MDQLSSAMPQNGFKWLKPREKDIPNHIINKKADRKLDYLVDQFSLIMGDKFIRKTSTLLNKTLYCQGFRFLKYLNLRYTYENRLWAFSYNLNYKTTVEAIDGFGETQPCRFIIKNIGKVATTDAQWIDGGCQCSADRRERYLELLNNKLIIDRIVDMDIINGEVIYDPNGRFWKISCRTLIGSTTWILIPPVLSLIKPRPQEYVKVLEFYELVADAVSTRN